MDDKLKDDDIRSSLASIAAKLGIPGGGRDRDIGELLALVDSGVSELASSGSKSRQAAETLRVACLALARNLDLTGILETLIDYLNWIVPYDAACVILEQADELVVAASRDFRSGGMQGARAYSFHSGELSGWVRDLMASRQTCEACFPDGIPAPSPGARGESVTRARLGVPLSCEQGTFGAVVIEKTEPESFGESNIRNVEAFASQAAAAIRNSQLYAELVLTDEGLIASYDATIEGWSATLELRDHNTEGHTQRVTELTLRLARLVGVDDAEIVDLRRGALLHDIGKMGIPDAILLKLGALDAGERETMNRHPVLAYKLLENVPFLRNALDIPYCHHERWDGTGYPRGLSGRAIPLAARIFAVVDVWDALTHERPYHAAWSQDDALEYIRLRAGSHFDPEIVEAFLAMLS